MLLGGLKGSKMVFKEIKEDLFNIPDEYAIVHCISSDFALGAGIAKAIDEKYGVKDLLKKYYTNANPYITINNDDWIGMALYCESELNGRIIYNLVTKSKYWQKPTYESLMCCLADLVDNCLDEKITKLVMPRIGCGLDKLDWNIVRDCIKLVFNDTDIEIIVCSLD